MAQTCMRLPFSVYVCMCVCIYMCVFDVVGVAANGSTPQPGSPQPPAFTMPLVYPGQYTQYPSFQPSSFYPPMPPMPSMPANVPITPSSIPYAMPYPSSSNPSVPN